MKNTYTIITAATVLLSVVLLLLWQRPSNPITITVCPPPPVKVPINKAPYELLLLLPGVGRRTAGKIISYRLRQPIRSRGDLADIVGFGSEKISRLLRYVEF